MLVGLLAAQVKLQTIERRSAYELDEFVFGAHGVLQIFLIPVSMV